MSTPHCDVSDTKPSLSQKGIRCPVHVHVPSTLQVMVLVGPGFGTWVMLAQVVVTTQVWVVLTMLARHCEKSRTSPLGIDEMNGGAASDVEQRQKAVRVGVQILLSPHLCGTVA